MTVAGKMLDHQIDEDAHLARQLSQISRDGRRAAYDAPNSAKIRNRGYAIKLRISILAAGMRV
jgi:hypothetical protein